MAEQMEEDDQDDDIKIIQPKTEISDILSDPATLLMTNALHLFEQYDSKKNGKLTLPQFKAMVTKLYPNYADNDEFLESIKTTFSYIIRDNQSSDFYYKDNVHNLAEELHSFSQLPDKNELLTLFRDIFGPLDDEEVIKSVYDNLNEEDGINKIEIAKKIHDEFIRNVESKNKRQVQIARDTVNDLWRWIKESGIPSIEENQALKKQNEENIDTENDSNDSNDEEKKERGIDKLHEEILNYLKEEIPRLIIDTLKSSFIEYQHKPNDDDVESIQSEQSSSFDKHLILKKQIDDEMKETLQSNILHIITLFKEEIIGRIDEIQEEKQNLTLKAKQKQLLEDDYKEQQEYEHEIEEIIPPQQQQQQQQNEDLMNKLSVLFEPEIIINKLSTKMDNLLLTINNNKDGINQYLQILQNEMKNNIKSMLDDQRKCIGLDVSQTMRFLINGRENINEEEKCNKSFNDRLYDQVNINKHHDDKNSLIKQHNNDEEEDDDDGKDKEYENTTTRTSIPPLLPSHTKTLPSSTDFGELETRIVENVDKSIKSIKPSYLKIGGSTFISTIVSFFLFGLIIFFGFIDVNSLWSQQMEHCQVSKNDGFIDLQKQFEDLKIQIMKSDNTKNNELQNKLKGCIEREKELDLEFKKVKKDIKELNALEFAQKYPEIYK